MIKALKSKIKLLVVIAIIGTFVWIFVISPTLTFKTNEKKLEDAARRYYELNPNLLPTGERVGTVTLNTLYKKSYIDKDLFIPMTKTTCSITNSWVKVRNENGEYKYYTYLECGVMSSTIDHKGPEIKLNGDTDITLGVGEEFSDPGVKNVVDNKDGKLDTKNVKISGKVDTSKVGTYEITYTASDDLNNSTSVVRSVVVVQKFNSLVKKNTNDLGYYTGSNPDNYVYFSNMLFRIVGTEGNNVKLVADQDIANVNYSGLNDWLKYYESNLTSNAKKYIKATKYCESSGKIDVTSSKCNSTGKKRNVWILSAYDVYRAYSKEDNGNYLLNKTISWLSNTSTNEKGKKTGLAFSNSIYSDNYSFNYFLAKYNLGVRPVITINGNILVTDGNGSSKKPYVLEDYIKPVPQVNVNERYVGEYIKYGGLLWRISKIENDGTVRLISEHGLINSSGYYLIDNKTGSSKKIYNPKQKGNVGYIINNKASQFFKTNYIVSHEIEVPIYKNLPAYGKEVETKKYNVKVSAPNMYEMFSASTENSRIGSYWLINSSKNDNLKLGISKTGVAVYDEYGLTTEYGVRPVVYLNKDCIISSGSGTKNRPFLITK